jgi:hypothetical protein
LSKAKTIFLKRTIFLSLLTISILCCGLQVNSPIQDLLNKPFDLQKFKKKKGQSNSGGAPKKTYYYKPNENGFMMRFMLFPPYGGYIGKDTSYLIKYPEAITIITFKPNGKHQDMFIDPNETLIEIILRLNDKDLPELAFVGMDTTSIKEKLGADFFRKDNCFIYANKKAALTLKISGKNVQWIKYTRLNFEMNASNIPTELLIE